MNNNNLETEIDLATDIWNFNNWLYTDTLRFTNIHVTSILNSDIIVFSYTTIKKKCDPV